VWATKFCTTLVPNIFSIVVLSFYSDTKLCIPSYAPSRKSHLTVSFTGHTSCVDSWYRTYFVTLWHLVLDVAARLLQNLWTHVLDLPKYIFCTVSIQSLCISLCARYNGFSVIFLIGSLLIHYH